MSPCPLGSTDIHVLNFQKITQLSDNRSTGVAAYQNNDANGYAITPHINSPFHEASPINAFASRCGDICAVIYQLQNGSSVVILAIYISPNNSINDIINFIHFNLCYLIPTRGCGSFWNVRNGAASSL